MSKTIIRNAKSLATNRRKSSVLRILDAAMTAAMPTNSLKNLVKTNRIIINGKSIKLSKYDNVYLVAYGKAADSMAKVVNSMIDIKSGIIVISKYTTPVIKNKKFKIFKCGHPLPNKQSVSAAKTILKFLQGTKENDFVIFLVSGGGSSLLSLPEGVTLQEKKHLTDLLLRSSATIHEINCVRKHLSGIKGGKLASYVKNDAISLVMSDVVGDDLSSISSGCTYYDTTTFQRALKIIKRYNLENSTPKKALVRFRDGIAEKLPETPKKIKIKNVIVATNQDCLKAMIKKAREIGFEGKVVYPVSGDVKREAQKLAKCVPRKPKSCIIFGGEPTVCVKGSGKGGRNQELVLRILKHLKKTKNITIASMGTDGVDGNTKYAGAITDVTLNSDSMIDSFLQNNDSSTFFKKHGGLIFTGPTHTNLMDVGIILKL